MPNMSYCRMENTYNDLLDCYENWENVNSKSEIMYKDKILELCKDLLSEEEDFINK